MLRTITFQGQTVYELSKGRSTALIAPQGGARLLNWKVDGKPVVYWPEEADWSRVAHVRGGNPILFPFIARHMVNGEIGWWLDATGTKRELPMHGFARNAVFTVIPESDPDTLRMRITPTEQTRAWYPFEFIFDVVYRIGDSELESRLEVTNTGHDPMPYYTGHHFYFAVPHDARERWETTIPCERWGGQDFKTGDIVEKTAQSAVTSLSDPNLSDRLQIGLTAKQVSLLERGTGKGVVFELEAGGNVPWYDVTTWTQDAKSDFYCVEPWTGLPNAIHNGKGLRYLSPGAKESAVCVIKATV